MMINSDILESQFNLVNDGVLILNSTSAVTKMNKSAEIMFNTIS
jgi:sensor histidine kinase regulating citrate/malate metabolism